MRWSMRPFPVPSARSRPRKQAELHVWITGARAIQAGFRNEGRDLCSGQAAAKQFISWQRNWMNTCKDKLVGKSSFLISLSAEAQRMMAWLSGKTRWQSTNPWYSLRQKGVSPPGFDTESVQSEEDRMKNTLKDVRICYDRRLKQRLSS